jgi:hypothetical protein
MSLSKQTVQAMIDIVAADAECRKLLSGWHRFNPLSAMGWAGAARNDWLIIFSDTETVQKYYCIAVAEATVAAIHQRRKEVPDLKTVGQIHRSPDGWEHEATRVVLQDDSIWVVDWHKSLDPWNPFVSTREDWLQAKNEIAFRDWGSIRPNQLGRWGA